MHRTAPTSPAGNGASRPAVLLILLLGLLPMLQLAVPADPAAADPSRAIDVCPGSEPPPEDPTGHRWGDWTIDCPPNQPVKVTDEVVRIRGNITVAPGTILRLGDNARITQYFSSSSRYLFEVKEGATLIVEGKSELHVDMLRTWPASIVEMDGSKLTAGGYVNITSEVLQLENSYLINEALNGAEGQKGADANLLMDASTARINETIILNIAGKGGAGTDGEPAGTGGDAYASVIVHEGLIMGSEVNVTGGGGGVGGSSTATDGSPGGMGGNAYLDLRFPSPYVMTMMDDIVTVNGGPGGSGGNGAIGETSPGSDGGRGEVGGRAELDIKANGLIVDGSIIQVAAGDGGFGGSGGEGLTGQGGNGSPGGRGGNAMLRVEDDGPLEVTASDLGVIGGDGGDGGFFGSGDESDGSPGNAGSGGDASFVIDAAGPFDVEASDIVALGGTGGDGGLGGEVSGGGGDGGDALLQANCTGAMTATGVPGDRPSVGAVSGDGGQAGYTIGESGLGGGLRGWGGDGGHSTTILRSTWSIEITEVDLRAYKAVGGAGGKKGADGVAALTVDTQGFNMTNASAEWTLEGFDGLDIAVLTNVSFGTSPLATVAPGETEVIVEAWNTITVDIPEALWDETWEIWVYEGEIWHDVVAGRTTVKGDQPASFFLRTARVDHTGVDAIVYHVLAHCYYLNKETYVSEVVPLVERAVHLDVSGNVYAPHIEMTTPVDHSVITVDRERLAPCRDPTPEEVEAGLSAPVCLWFVGEAWEDGLDTEGGITDIRITLKHELMGTSFTTKSTPAVTINSPGERRTGWVFKWEVGKVNISTGRYEWASGEWTISVASFDGLHWSDDIERGGEVVSVTITIVRPMEPTPTLKVDAGPYSQYDIGASKNGIMVPFKDAIVNYDSDSTTLIRLEWDYEGDGIVDWSGTTDHCLGTDTCAPPPTEHFFSEEGIYSATFCAVDEIGQKVCDSKAVIVNQETTPIVGLPPELMFITSLTVIVMSSVITSALIIASLSEAAKYALMSFILIPLYSRLKKEEMLDNYTRGEIRGYIVANPGTHYSRIKRDLKLNNGALIYHLRTLEREGFIYSHRDDYYRRFYPRGRKPRPGPNLTTVQESIIEELLLRPDQTTEEVAKRLEKSRKVINYHLVWLRRWGLIEARKVGKRKTYSVIYEDDIEKEEDSPEDEDAEEEGALEGKEEGKGEAGGL